MKNNKIRTPILKIIFMLLSPLFLLIWLFNNESMKEMFDEWGHTFDPISI